MLGTLPNLQATAVVTLPCDTRCLTPITSVMDISPVLKVLVLSVQHLSHKYKTQLKMSQNFSPGYFWTTIWWVNTSRIHITSRNHFDFRSYFYRNMHATIFNVCVILSLFVAIHAAPQRGRVSARYVPSPRTIPDCIIIDIGHSPVCIPGPTPIASWTPYYGPNWWFPFSLVQDYKFVV